MLVSAGRLRGAYICLHGVRPRPNHGSGCEDEEDEKEEEGRWVFDEDEDFWLSEGGRPEDSSAEELLPEVEHLLVVSLEVANMGETMYFCAPGESEERGVM